MTRLKIIVPAIVLAGILSCKDESVTVDKLDQIVFPDSVVSYNRHVQPLFNLACATSGCHDRPTTENRNLDLTNYQSARYGSLGVIVPYDTVQSRLIWSIEGKNGAALMPPFNPLSSNHIKGLKRWIMEGATDSIK